jgi:biotin operon repressor
MKVNKMATIREVLYQNTKKVSSRNIAKAFNMSNTTIKKYIKLAKAHGYICTY